MHLRYCIFRYWSKNPIDPLKCNATNAQKHALLRCWARTRRKRHPTQPRHYSDQTTSLYKHCSAGRCVPQNVGYTLDIGCIHIHKLLTMCNMHHLLAGSRRWRHSRTRRVRALSQAVVAMAEFYTILHTVRCTARSQCCRVCVHEIKFSAIGHARNWIVCVCRTRRLFSVFAVAVCRTGCTAECHCTSASLTMTSSSSVVVAVAGVGCSVSLRI